VSDPPEVAGLRVQLATTTARLERIEEAAAVWAHSTAPTSAFVTYLRREGLLRSGT
jgi:hypothetical protein